MFFNSAVTHPVDSPTVVDKQLNKVIMVIREAAAV
jgi:hypothetical protein